MPLAAPLEPAYCVDCLDTCLPFYKELLDAQVLMDTEVPQYRSAPTAISDTGYRVVRLLTETGDIVKLLAPIKAKPVNIPRNSGTSHTGAAFLTVIVEDVEAALKQAPLLGRPLLSDGIVHPRDGISLAMVSDPSGNLIEVVSHSDLAEYRSDLVGTSRLYPRGRIRI